MPQFTKLDSIKIQDSAIVLNNNIIELKHKVIDSLNGKILLCDKILKSKELAITKLSTISYQDRVLNFLCDLRYFMFTRECLIFVAACSLMGLIIISIDYVTFKVGDDESRTSFLVLKYSTGKAILINYLLWGLGSGLLAYITSAIGIFKFSLSSCVVIAITWPGLFPKIIKKISESKDGDVEQ